MIGSRSTICDLGEDIMDELNWASVLIPGQALALIEHCEYCADHFKE